MRPDSELGATLAADEVASPLVESHEETGTYRAQFDRYTRTASEAILTGVTEATGKGPLELPPLYSAIDSTALDRLEETVQNNPEQRMTITFEYASCQVKVNGHGTVLVDPEPEEETD